MSRIILFAQQKGGAGKTTLLTQLAAHWAGAGKRLALIDLDPQRSLAGWVDQRAKSRAGELDFEFRESSEWRAGGDIRRASAEADLVLVDCPGAADALLRGALREADLVLIPVQPSAPDAWASRAILKMAAREGALARCVLNRAPPRGGPGEKVAAMLEEDGAEFCATRIGARVAYANAFLEGRGVTETSGAAKARAEIAALAREVEDLC